MRRLHKVFYLVGHDGDDAGWWWCRGDWHQDPPEGYAASSDKYCRTTAAAYRCALRLESKGGMPLISKSSIYNGVRRWTDYRLKPKVKRPQ